MGLLLMLPHPLSTINSELAIAGKMIQKTRSNIRRIERRALAAWGITTDSNLILINKINNTYDSIS